MFSGHWYLSISLSIESLSTIKSPAAAGGERVHGKKNREAQRVRQQRQWRKINSSENGNGHAMISMYLQQIIKVRTHIVHMGLTGIPTYC